MLQVEAVGLAHEAVQELGGGVDPVPGQKDPLHHGHVDVVQILDHVDRDDQQHQDQQQGVGVADRHQLYQQPVPALRGQLLRRDQQIHQRQNQ